MEDRQETMFWSDFVIITCFSCREKVYWFETFKLASNYSFMNFVRGRLNTNWSEGPLWPPWSYSRWIYDYLCNQCLSPLKLWVRTPFMARCTRYDIMWLSLAGWWFSPGTPVSSTNKTAGHYIAEILFKVVLNTITPVTQLKRTMQKYIYMVCVDNTALLTHQFKMN